MCASSNCRRADVDHGRVELLDLARRERVRVDGAALQRAAVEGDDRLKFGGCGRRLAVARADELVLVVDVQQLVVAALVADRRADLEIDRRPAAQRAAEMARPHLDVVAERQQLLVQRPEDPARALLLLDRQIGPRDVAHEQRVAGQHRPRLVAARGVDERERGVLRPVPGRVQRAHHDRPER